MASSSPRRRRGPLRGTIASRFEFDINIRKSQARTKRLKYRDSKIDALEYGRIACLFVVVTVFMGLLLTGVLGGIIDHDVSCGPPY